MGIHTVELNLNGAILIRSPGHVYGGIAYFLETCIETAPFPHLCDDSLFHRGKESIMQGPVAGLSRRHIQLDVPLRTDSRLGGPEVKPGKRVVRRLLHSNLRPR